MGFRLTSANLRISFHPHFMNQTKIPVSRKRPFLVILCISFKTISLQDELLNKILNIKLD